MKKLFVSGAATVNLLIHLHEFPKPEPGTVFASSWRRTVGGTGAGKAMALSAIGFDVTLQSLLGKDPEGEIVRGAMEAAGVRYNPSPDPAGTETHTNLMDAEGRRISIYTNLATFEPDFRPEDWRAEIRASDAVVLNLSHYVRKLIPIAQEEGKETWIDVHDWDGKNPFHRDFVEGADHLFLSSENMPGWRGFMEERIGRGAKTVVCTHGKDGADGMDQNRKLVHVPAVLDYGMVDTNGAGDSFFAGFMAAASRGLSLAERLRWGSVAGALTVASPDLVSQKLSARFLEAEASRIPWEEA